MFQPLDEVRAKVEDALKASKAAELAKVKAQEFAEKAKTAGGLEKLAKSYSVEVKTSEEFTRNGNLQDLGSSSPFDSFAFSSEVGSISQPIQVGQRQVVAQLKEKQAVNPEEFAKAKDGLRQSLLTPKKDKNVSDLLGFSARDNDQSRLDQDRRGRVCYTHAEDVAAFSN